MTVVLKSGFLMRIINVKYGMIYILHSCNELMENELDTTWFDEQMNIEKNYDDFYNNDATNVKATVMFVDENNTLVHIKRQKVKISNGTFTRAKIVEIVRNNRKLNAVKYNLYALLQFNYTISPDRVLQGKLGTGEEFFEVITHIQDVFFDKTISILEDLNDLTFVMKVKQSSSRNLTKKVYLTTTSKKKRRKTRKTY